jgi:hypothetical protein
VCAVSFHSSCLEPALLDNRKRSSPALSLFWTVRTWMCGHALRGWIRVEKLCGASRDRTDDPLLAKQVLSQLSYGPMIGPERPKIPWWVWEDSNLRPHPYQGCALTT